MKWILTLSVLTFLSSVLAVDYACPDGKSKKSITIKKDQTFNFDVAPGYGAKTKCSVMYKPSKSKKTKCKKLKFSCTTFDLPNKDAKKCRKGDKLRVGKQFFCKSKSPSIQSTKPIKLMFMSDKKDSSGSATCTIECVGSTPAPSPPTTTTGTTTTTVTTTTVITTSSETTPSATTTASSEGTSANDVIAPPTIENTVYVDGPNGSDNNDGASEQTPLKSLRKAIQSSGNKTRIYVMNGEYNNNNYGGGPNNGAVMTIKDKTDILVSNFPGHSPIIRFDGSGGIVMLNVQRVEITGLEIVGPNADITLEQAQADRLIKSKMFLGRGIVSWSGNNIFIHHNKVHHCPHSGIRVDNGDYIAIEDNEVYSNTWWGSSAESAIVIAEATNIDQIDGPKIFLRRNTVYDNRNIIPFYNANGSESEGHSRPDYGTAEQTYIIDGSGVYVTRNQDTYAHSWMWLNHNKAYNNGINGLVVHKTDRVQVIGNVIWDNGKVPKTAPENRQSYAGLTLNHARTVKVSDNIVKTERNDDFAYVSVSGSTLTSGSGNNKNCKVAKESGTGYGKIQSELTTLVSTATWSECMSAQTQ